MDFYCGVYMYVCMFVCVKAYGTVHLLTFMVPQDLLFPSCTTNQLGYPSGMF